jgi:GrpB-like predicted nucleotidyltransferase (UPF0157 family)
MPPPIKVELLEHDPAWQLSAAADAGILLTAMGPCLRAVHYVGSTAIAFRDYRREHVDVAAAYDREKARCRSRFPGNSHDYGDCKEVWIRTAEAEALVWYQARSLGPAPP